MSHTTYFPDTNHKTADTEQAKQAVAGVGPARSGEGVPGAPWGSDAAADASFQRMAAGIPGGVTPREFRAGMDAGHHRLGNRAFLRWVGELRGSGQSAQSLADEVAAGPIPSAVSRVAAAGPLQLMPKKKKKAGQSASTVTPEAGGTAMSGADVETMPESEAVVTLPQSEPEPGVAAAPGQKKKKKKPRVQVALNTLREEGVEAFKSYIDAEIREAELLRTLAERIGRAQNLGDNKESARRVVEDRLRVLDPESVPVIAQAVGPGAELGRAVPDIAPVKAELSPREYELFTCCASGNVRRLKQLLRYRKIDINMGSEYGTPLCSASFNGHAGLVRELLSMPGIDVNLAHQTGMTPLYRAAQNGHVEVVKLLLAARGINVNLVEMEGVTPLYIAAQNGRVEVVKLLLAAPGININLAEVEAATPLYIAAQNGHVEVVRLLLAAPGINVNLAEMEGATPLCIAAQVGQEEEVKLLLDAPTVRIDARKADGATALFNAAQDNFPRIVELLIKRGADVNLALDTGTTPLVFAAHSGHIEVVRVLLRAPAIEVNHMTKSAITALAMACAKGHQDVVTLLLEKGADPNIAHDNGIAPLHTACLRGRTDIVKILLDAGADMDGETAIIPADGVADSYTPHRIAELMGHREIMTLLEQHRQARAVQVETLSPEDEPGRSSPSTALPEPVSLPATTPATQAEHTHSTPSVAAESQATGGMEPADRALPSAAPELPAQTVPGSGPAPVEPRTPLALGKQELVQEILRKLEQDNLGPLQGIRLLVEVRASASIDGLCGIYNRLADIERRSERVRRRGGRRRELVVGVEALPAAVSAPRYALGEKADLDADAVEDEIKDHLEQTYHRFISQAVNDMEFGRGKRTTRYAGLWHASAGIAGVGSCSVFYYVHEETQVIRIVGIGHHIDQTIYRLNYATEELGRSGQTLRIA